MTAGHVNGRRWWSIALQNRLAGVMEGGRLARRSLFAKTVPRPPGSGNGDGVPPAPRLYGGQAVALPVG